MSERKIKQEVSEVPLFEPLSIVKGKFTDFNITGKKKNIKQIDLLSSSIALKKG